MNREKRRNTQVEHFEESPDREIELMELFYRLLERAKYIVAVGLIGALLMGVQSAMMSAPAYEATSKLFVVTTQQSAFDVTDFEIGDYLASDYKEVFDTWEVLGGVIENLDLDYSYSQLRGMLKLKNPSDTRVLHIIVTAGDPVEAASIANEFARVAQQYIPEVMLTDEPRILSEAVVPSAPVADKTVRNAVLGFLAGALVMIAVIIAQFLLDDKIKNADDIARYVDMPTLAIVPTDSGRKGKSRFGRKGGSR